MIGRLTLMRAQFPLWYLVSAGIFLTSSSVIHFVGRYWQSRSVGLNDAIKRLVCA